MLLVKLLVLVMVSRGSEEPRGVVDQFAAEGCWCLMKGVAAAGGGCVQHPWMRGTVDEGVERVRLGKELRQVRKPGVGWWVCACVVT